MKKFLVTAAIAVSNSLTVLGAHIPLNGVIF